MRFEVLGPVRASVGGRQVALGPHEQQRLLALLLAAPGGLTADRLVDELWGEAAPPSARHLVQVYVSRLRAALGPTGTESCIRHEGGRYSLLVAPEDVDARDVVARAREARARMASDPTGARSMLAALERLWRGTAYQGLAEGSPLLEAEVARLEALRREIVVDRVGADLQLGRHAEVVAELERLTAEHPFAEDLWHHRMLALYRCGRAAEALQACRDLRDLLAGDLGVDPCVEVRDLERRILAQDPELRWQPPAPRSNLPMPQTSFVGRAREIATVCELVGEQRVVTLTGPGGIGKTRLAIEVAGRVRGSFPDGIVWIDLSPVDDPSMVLPEVARALGVISVPAHQLLEVIGRSLARRRALLVLDNCELVAPAVAELVSAVLPVAPTLRVLVTSRVPMHLSAEVRWPVPGLSWTVVRAIGEGGLPDAVRLFADRARAVGQATGLEAGDLAAAAELCRRLDGMPLAIEMAASRTDVLSVAELLDTLGDRAIVLQSTMVDVPARHRSLEAALDWSYQQLPASLRDAFDRASAFVGTFDLDAATAVACRADDARASADVMTGLLDASLLSSDRLDGRRGFRMLQSVRAYGRSHLVARGEVDSADEAHGEHFLSLLVRAGQDLQTPAFAHWVERLTLCYPDVRQALAWSLAHQPRARTLDAALGLFGFWYRTGNPGEADVWSAVMLEGSEGAAPESLAAAHLCRAFACDLLTRAEEGAAHADQAAGLYRGAGDLPGLALALWGRSSLALQMGDIVTVEQRCADALEVWATAGNRWGRAAPLATLALARVGAGAPAAARAMAEEALALHRELGDIPGQTVLNPLPLIALALGDPDAAQGYAADMVEAAAGTGWLAPALGHLAAALIAQGDLGRGREVAGRALLVALDAGLEIHFRIALRDLSLMACRRGDVESAAILLGASRRDLPQYALDRRIYSDVEGACRARFGQEGTDALMARGLAMPHAALVDLALA
jgi:predicted ATPase/DNA-binding SARP family transcriptional activator